MNMEIHIQKENPWAEVHWAVFVEIKSNSLEIKLPTSHIPNGSRQQNIVKKNYIASDTILFVYGYKEIFVLHLKQQLPHLCY